MIKTRNLTLSIISILFFGLVSIVSAAPPVATISIDSPANGDTVSSTIGVTVTYDIDKGNVHTIQLVAAGEVAGSVAVHNKSGTHTFQLNTGNYDNGALLIEVKAYQSAPPADHVGSASIVITVLNAACNSDADCNDDNALTTDACASPGTAQAACSNVPCPVACGADVDCDDGNALTTDGCASPGACSAVCSNIPCPVACNAGTDCDDGNALTIDSCSSAGLCSAACSNTPCGGACSDDAGCDDSNILTTDTCLNAGTCSASCSNEPCSVSCGSAADCDDGNALTVDTCQNPGACGASCANTAIACNTDADCADGNPQTSDTCSGGGTTAAVCLNAPVESQPEPETQQEPEPQPEPEIVVPVSQREPEPATAPEPVVEPEVEPVVESVAEPMVEPVVEEPAPVEEPEPVVPETEVSEPEPEQVVPELEPQPEPAIQEPAPELNPEIEEPVQPVEPPSEPATPPVGPGPTINAPALTVAAPAEDALTNRPAITVEGATDGDSVNVNGVPASLSGGGFSAAVSLSEGANTITVIASNEGGATTLARRVALDTIPPETISITPTDGASIPAGTTIVSLRAALLDPRGGSGIPRENVSLTVAGAGATFRFDETTGVLEAALPADDSPNMLVALTASDRAGNPMTPVVLNYTFGSDVPGPSPVAPTPGGLFYSSSKAGDYNIYLNESGQTAPVTNGAAYEGRPSYAPGRLAYVREENGQYQLYIAELEGDAGNLSTKNEKKISSGGSFNSEPSISAGGTRVVYVSGGDLYLKDLAGDSAPVKLTDGMRAVSPTISPDGMKVVFTSNAGGGYALYILDADVRGEPRQLTTPETGLDVDPVFSPDGGVYFVSNRDGQFDIYKLSLADNSIARTTNTPEREVRPSFTPTGALVCSIRKNGGYGIFRIDTQTGTASELVNGGGNNLAR